MSISLTQTSEAYDKLKNYNGDNPYLINLKNDVFAYKKITLNDFHTEYVLKNYDKKPFYYNKIVKIAKWYGMKKQEEWETEFVPEKLLIGYYLGETTNLYHVYVKYRKSLEQFISLFIPKTAILNPLFIEDFNNKEIDFSKYNTNGFKLKPQQEQAIKFLTTRKKGILALQMGSGKTIASIVAALEDKYEKILIICPASVKTTWLKEVSLFEKESDITIVEGSTWKEARFTIINYDILDNFYEIPTETVKRKVKNVDDNGKITYKTVEKEIISKKSTIINEAMANSQLFQSQFDLIIIDEAHRLSNANSGRYKIITDLIKRSNPKGVYELTGTMITNNPMNLYNILKIIDADITKDWQSYVKNYCDGKQIFVKGERDKFTNAFLKKKNKSTWNDLTYQEKNELNEYLDKNCKKIWLTNGASNLDELKERIKHLYLRDLNEDIYKNFKKETKLLSYSLSKEEKQEYNNIWEQYVSTLNENERDIDKILDNKKLIEGSVLRQATSQMMIPHTIKLTEEIINNSNDKVIIFCAFDKEIYELQEYFKDKCVVHNGKLTIKAKEKAIDTFKNDDNCRILLGNLVSTSVGLNLIVANHVIFNSVSWLPAENQQAEYRILRIGQNKDCFIYYQSFNETYLDRMFELLNIKNEIIDAVIVDEKNK
jgi:SWI/SNF-related matrix-associated actin-dependent regulator 1 of chromatin subfamily A